MANPANSQPFKFNPQDPQFLQKRSIIERELKDSVLKGNRSFEMFKKSAEEKLEISIMKKKWKTSMKKTYGKDWKKHKNPSI